VKLPEASRFTITFAVLALVASEISAEAKETVPVFPATLVTGEVARVWGSQRDDDEFQVKT
jgi:hypothetical protein